MFLYLAVLQNRANQQHQQITNNITFSNPQQSIAPVVNQSSHLLNQMYNQSPRFSVTQQQPPAPRMNNPQPNPLNQMTRLREPQKLIPSNILKYFSIKILFS
jgi:hypothetical protein